MRMLLTMLLVMGLAGCGHSLAPDRSGVYRPAAGDLLFQDLDGSPLCDAIETVTQGYRGARFSHVGIVAVAEPGGETQVIEAGGKGVVLTPLSKFLGRSRDGEGRPKVLVGRLKGEARERIPQAVAFARQQLGKPYDRTYVLRGDAYYCSELVWDSFKGVFEPQPMTFKDPRSGETLPAWTEYFAKLGVPIPEGEPGVNPAAMSRDRRVEIVYVFGQVTRNR